MISAVFIPDVVPAVVLLQDISRSLLTVGVGLFLGYVVLMIGANIFGLVPRYTAKLANRQHQSNRTSRPQLASSTTARHETSAGSVALKEEIL